MQQFKAIETTLEEDLGDFSAFLYQQGIAHRVNEETGRQVMYVEHEAHLAPVQQAYAAFHQGTLVLKRIPSPAQEAVRESAEGPRFHPWLSYLIIVLCLLGGVLVAIDPYGVYVHYLTFQDFQYQGQTPVPVPALESFSRGEYWRLVTPMFLHFGLAHTVFNSLWMWDLGRRIEYAQGRTRLLGIVLLTSAGANIGQYVWAADVAFGGLSGVVYGLLGYCWMYARFRAHPALVLPQGIIIFMLIWLVVGMTDVLGAIGMHMANGAHLIGLVVGMALGVGAGLIGTSSSEQSARG